MSPREKRRIALFSLAGLLVAILCLALVFIPTVVYAVLISAVISFSLVYHLNGPQQQIRIGPPPRAGLTLLPAVKRWLPGKTANGFSSPGSRGFRGQLRGDIRESAGHIVNRSHKSEASAEDSSGSLLFSPSDFQMGSYLAKTENPSVAGGTRELREKLSRPNHYVQSPNRRLSFGDHVGHCRFTVTPHRRYAIQQAGYSSIGVLPSVQWDGFHKKSVLLPRNSAMPHSPVTVKIARPDSGKFRSPFLENLASPVTFQSPLAEPSTVTVSDPCAKETVLNALKESRKRRVEEEEERSFNEEQDNKRRRHDSSGSAHSAFEPLLANGSPSLLIPKPGTLKRGSNSLVLEDTVMKRSRTSTGNSQNCGVPGSARNPVLSSYSSLRGYSKWKKNSTFNTSPLSSPESSRPQTPERAPKKPRDDEIQQSHSSTPVKQTKVWKEQPAKTDKPSPQLNSTSPTTTPNSTSASPGDSSEAVGKRKRKIPLVSCRRGEQIALPPPPELGYKITVSDLDFERKAVLNRIKKVFEEADPSRSSDLPSTSTQSPLSTITPATAVSSAPGILLDWSKQNSTFTSSFSPITSSQAISTVAPLTSSGLTLLPNSTATLTTLTTTPIVTSSPANPDNSTITSPLLQSLGNIPNMLEAAPGTTTTPASNVDSGIAPASTPGNAALAANDDTVSSKKNSDVPKAKTILDFGVPASQATSSQTSSSSTSAFGQLLKSPLQTTANSLALPGQLSNTQSTAPPVSTTSFSSAPAFSAFKPVFGAPTTKAASPVSTPAPAATFKPIFGNGTAGITFGSPMTSIASSTSNSIFTTPSKSQMTSTTEVAAKPVFTFGNASGNSVVNSQNTQTTTTTNSTSQVFQFGTSSVATTTSGMPFSSTPVFSLGKVPSLSTSAAATTSTTLAPTSQATFTFGSSSTDQNAATNTFGSFSSVTAAPRTTTATQATFGFGNSVSSTLNNPPFSATITSPFGGAVTSNAFGSSSASSTVQPAVTKSFTFLGTSTTPSFNFGSQPTTTAPAFGANSQPLFGNTSATFSFGKNTTTATAAPIFGSNTQTSSSSTSSSVFGATHTAPTGFSFGSQASAPTIQSSSQSGTGGFNFAAANTQFGAPTANQTGLTTGFAFGASNANESKPGFGGSLVPAFGQSSSSTPMSFGSPTTPASGFNNMVPSTPFGSATPSFSIGSGSKPSGRQRLQARRQHPRKK
ncbi:PO121 protein, partial [Polypterus senegalus]|nr:nuclear envelope pore membrane protein POM 121 [Polypterus senegalus]MBN3293932.1 PO121 protein [Polypterus senegalus]